MITTLDNGTRVKVRTSNDFGEIISSELKRFPYINNGKQIRIYKVLLDRGRLFEYEIADLTTQF